MEFKSLQELYDRIKPVLKSKKMELHRMGYNYIKEEDIWNCLREIKWKKTNDLSLAEMVNDVLLTENYVIDNFVKKEMNNAPRQVDLANNEEAIIGE